MYLFVNYPMSRYPSQDAEIREAITAAVQPFGVGESDGSGSDFETRDISFTLPEGCDHEGVLLAAASVMFGYDGKAQLMSADEDGVTVTEALPEGGVSITDR